MSKRIWIGIFAIVSGVCAAVGACSSSGEKTNPSSNDGDGNYNAGAAPSLGRNPSGPQSCVNFFKNKNKCGACAEEKCCPVLIECSAAQGCQECLTGDAAKCEKNKEVLNKLAACAQSQCADECKPAPPPAPACDAAASPPSGGSCLKLGQKATCNPVSNAGCDGAKGEACDIGQNGFQCHSTSTNNLRNNLSLCSECGPDKGLCSGGHTCIGKCAKYCCDDVDCGTGKCDKSILNDPDLPIGLCIVR